MKCPGQETQYWNSTAIFEADCPSCGTLVEFFKDDTARKCSGCGKRFINPQMDFGCASYCQYAEQCIGELPEGVAEKFKGEMLKEKLALAVKKHLNNEYELLQEIAEIAKDAEIICRTEGGDLAAVLSIAYLFKLTDEMTEAILQDLGVEQGITEKVKAYNHHHKNPEFPIIHDAIILAETKRKNLKKEVENLQITTTPCLTQAGEELLTTLLK